MKHIQNFRNLMKKLPLFIICLLLTQTLACKVGDQPKDTAPDPGSEIQDVYIDNDADKNTALGLIFGMPLIDDRLDVDQKDEQDWRYIIVPESGRMSIIINLDTPEKMSGGWNILDDQGRTLHSQSFVPNQGYYEFKDYPVKSGVYFFKMYASSGKSIYTIGTSFSPNPPEIAPPTVIVETPPEPEPEPERTRTKSTSKPKRQQRAELPASTGSKKVTGFISIITLRDDGAADVTIRGAGTENGVQTGDVGQLEGQSLRLKTTRCRPTSCLAVIPENANPREIKKNSNVVFYVK